MRTHPIQMLADLRSFIGTLSLPGNRQRDLLSAIDAISEMLGRPPGQVPATAIELRLLLRTILPAANGISPKTFSNLRSLLVQALKLAGQVDDVPRGLANRHKDWQCLMHALYRVDKPSACALAAFATWCAHKNLRPVDVADQVVQEFHAWLETRSLHPAPKNLVRRIPLAWARTQDALKLWPRTDLSRISFRGPQLRMPWEELPKQFRLQAEIYLNQRKKPDLFDISIDMPVRPLAASTVRQQREHLRIAASILICQHGAKPDDVTLAYLVKPDAVRMVLQSLLEQAKQKAARKATTGEDAKPSETPSNSKAADVPPNAFAICLVTTLVQIARYYVKVQSEELRVLKKIKSRLTPVPFELTEKNKDLMRQLEVPATQAKLLFLPELLRAKVRNALKSDRDAFVDAQVALAIQLQLVLPLRPQNLHDLHWQRHFTDLGAKRLRLFIPASETKSRKRDISADIPVEVAESIDWYRWNVLPSLGASMTSYLFAPTSREKAGLADPRAHPGEIRVHRNRLCSQSQARQELPPALFCKPHSIRFGS